MNGKDKVVDFKLVLVLLCRKKSDKYPTQSAYILSCMFCPTNTAQNILSHALLP
jgi:hypothetical protein